MCLLWLVVDIERPQEGNRFACQDVGHKGLPHSHRDGPVAAVQDGQPTHRLHHLHLEGAALIAHLDSHIGTNE